MPVLPYLNFKGNCREAVEFYAQVFQTEPPQIMTFGESPPNPDFPMPAEAKDLVMHARINICGTHVMFSDTLPNMTYTLGNNISLSVVHKEIEELKSFFHQLKVGGKVQMEMQETFWSKCYGIVIDKFGIEWQLSYERDEMG